jgi:uncharacterized protein YndB with AHSA1/START domain
MVCFVRRLNEGGTDVPDVVFEFDVDAPPETVLRALTTTVGIQSFWTTRADAPALGTDHGQAQGVRGDRPREPALRRLAMPADVLTEIEIARPRAEVAAYAANPNNATAWYENIESVEWRTPQPLGVGSRLAFVASFLGRRLSYVYEIVELAEGERLVIRTADGPFAMETTYTWADSAAGTRMTLRNRASRPGSRGSSRRSWPPPCVARTGGISRRCGRSWKLGGIADLVVPCTASEAQWGRERCRGRLGRHGGGRCPH